MRSYETGRIFLDRLPKDGDLLQELTKIVKENEITCGIVKVIGAVSKAKFGYYDQEKREYNYLEVDQHLEIVSCIGNISLLNGEPMIHAHIAFADENGNNRGGHLAEGTKIFAAEAYIQELKGEKLIRDFDDPTGLTLWK